MARVESGASLDNNLRDVCDNDFRFPPIQGNLSRHSHGFALVLLRIRELPRARRRYPSREGLIGVFAAHVQKNIAFAGLMNSVHSVRYGCDFADVLCRFSSRVSCRGPDDLGQIFNLFSKLHAEKSEEYYCSGGNSRPSRPSGMGGGHFLVTPYDYSFHLVQLRFALKNSLKSPLCSCVSITLPAAS